MVALSLSNRLISRRFQGEQRDIQKIRWAFTRGRCCRSVLRHGTRLAQKDHTVWFGKGFYKSEDDALLEAIKKFEANRHQGRTVAITPPGHDP